MAGLVASGVSESNTQPYVPRPLTQSERDRAWQAANFFDATSGQEHPIALWILGPSSVGKSTISAQAATRFGVTRSNADSVNAAAEGEDKRSELDAVIIDGEYVRDVHAVYLAWINSSEWRSAYPAFKSTINKEKDTMCTQAIIERKNILIPQTMLNLSKGLTEVEEIFRNGYVSHVLAVLAPLEDCQRRGKAREITTGKRYEVREFEQSISAIQPMIEVCNGRYEILQAIERDGVQHGMDFTVLASGDCGTLSAHEFLSLAKAVIGTEHNALLIPENLRPERVRSPRCASHVPRPFTDEERECAWQLANFYAATSEQEQPVALWVIGPPHVGKSTCVSQLGSEFDIPLVTYREELRLDAVIIDGNDMRDAHEVYKSWMKEHDWQLAGPALKSIFNKEKDRLCTAASLKRKHLIIGRRLTDLHKGLTEIEELTWQGYTNHIVAIVAPLVECQRRGAERGQQCDSHDFEQSLAAIQPMIAACNGRYRVVRAVETNSGLEFRIRAQGRGSQLHVAATSLVFSLLDDLSMALADASCSH